MNSWATATRAEIAIVATVSAFWIQIAREMLHDYVSCRECHGTGANNPDCKVCKGDRYPRLKRLHALGWTNADLEDRDDGDGYARCPSSNCYGESCEFCEGEGRVPFHEQVQQERRALIFARYQIIPPLCTLDYAGRRRRADQLLSAETAGDLVESGKATRLNVLAFGREFYLHRDEDFPSLWRQARERAAAARRERLAA